MTDWTAEMLDTPLGTGDATTWDTASLEQHRARMAMPGATIRPSG
jgi:hypothetical protein